MKFICTILQFTLQVVILNLAETFRAKAAVALQSFPLRVLGLRGKVLVAQRG